MTQDYLIHYGVLGMKWGVRKDRNRSGGIFRKKKTRKELSVIKDRKKAVKKSKTLSTSELKERINRLKLEQQLRDLTESNLSPGRSAVKKILSSSGSKIATAFVTGAGLYFAKSAMTGEFDIKELASYMTPKPKK